MISISRRSFLAAGSAALTAAAWKAETLLVRETLARSEEPHWREFLGRWPAP